MIENIRSLRGIFAFMIFLHHMDLFWAGGDFAVAFFFMLSGYLLAKCHGDEIDQKNFDIFRFYSRRLSRIYPPHIICLIISIVFLQSDFTFATMRHTALSLALVQSWFSKHYIYMGGVIRSLGFCLTYYSATLFSPYYTDCLSSRGMRYRYLQYILS